jgi:hypothetical protein
MLLTMLNNAIKTTPRGQAAASKVKKERKIIIELIKYKTIKFSNKT